jgi:LuxR family quorum-sensing system transcriptional regulator SolR
MHPLFLSWIDKISVSKTESEILSVLTQAASVLGFEYVAYGIRRPFPITKPQIVMLSTYPEEWQARYVAAKYVEVDPTVKVALGRNEPVTWSGDSGSHESDFWEEASSFGIIHGWSSASRGADGTIGLLTLSRSAGVIGATEKASHQAAIVWLAQAAHVAMGPLMPANGLAEVPLTLREVDVLKWTADGKTAYEISRILNISESTVNFHVKNIVSKMGSSNKIQAVAKAALIGLLR